MGENILDECLKHLTQNRQKRGPPSEDIDLSLVINYFLSVISLIAL